MLIPIGTDRPLARPTVVNHGLLAVNIAIFVAGAAAARAQPEAARAVEEMFRLDPGRLRVWTLVTYAFLHGSLWHLLGNMLFLWVFGPNVEDRLGRAGYLAFYLTGAVVSGGLHALAYEAPVVGASGAIAAVTGAYLVLFPRTHIKTVLVFVLIGAFQIPAWWFIGGQIAFNLLMEAGGFSGRIATLAHLGGYAFGIGTSMALLWTGVLKREAFDLFSISRQAARRRQFRELAYQRQRAIQQGKNPEMALRPKADQDTIDRLAQARSMVPDRMERGDLGGAMAAYRALLDNFRDVPGGTLLPRRPQYDIANALFAAEDYATAATAYEEFLRGYPSDSETPVVRLMLGLINARYLNDPVRAKQEVAAALPELPESHRALATELLAELG